MRGLLKIGSISKDPTKHRVKELNTTGVPDPFKCEYYAFVDNFVNFEKAVHRDLSAQRYRANREFFRITVGPAIESFRLVSARMNEKIHLEWFSEGGSANRYNPKSKYSKEQQAKQCDEWKAKEDQAKRDREKLALNHLYEACKIGTEKEIEKAFSVFRHQPLFNLGEIKD